MLLALTLTACSAPYAVDIGASSASSTDEDGGTATVVITIVEWDARLPDGARYVPPETYLPPEPTNAIRHDMQ